MSGVIHRRLILILLIFISVIVPAAGETSTRRQTMDAVILVGDRFIATDVLEAWVESKEGYLVSRQEDELILRVPSSLIEGFADYLEEIADDVVKLEQSTDDIGQDLLEIEAGIKSKTELFERALVLIDQTDLATTFEIEKEILSILGDIERLQGRYRKLSGEADLALVTISFTVEEETVPQHLPSTFRWINAVDFYALIYEFVVQ
jgi:hypothetical protein